MDITTTAAADSYIDTNVPYIRGFIKYLYESMESGEDTQYYDTILQDIEYFMTTIHRLYRERVRIMRNGKLSDEKNQRLDEIDSEVEHYISEMGRIIKDNMVDNE